MSAEVAQSSSDEAEFEDSYSSGEVREEEQEVEESVDLTASDEDHDDVKQKESEDDSDSDSYTVEEEELPKEKKEEDVKKNKNWKLPIKELSQYVKDPEEMASMKVGVRKFYKHQNELLDMLRNIDKLHGHDDRSGSASASDDQPNALTASGLQLKFPLTLLPLSAAFHVKLIIYGTFGINVCLLILKLIAAVASGSLAVIASALDSFLDLLSGLILFATSYVMGRAQGEVYAYPGGTSRIEPLGIIIFASCMFTATLQLLVSAAERLLGDPTDAEIDLTTSTIVIILITVVTKALLYIYCSWIDGSESVEALKQDHRNDVISNSFGLLMAIAAYHFVWWLDPLGAIIMCLYIMSVWFRTGYGQVKMLSGMTAHPEILAQLTYLAWNHHPKIIAIDTVRAFHLAYKYLVEVDIVLPEDMPLKEAHDIGESLQEKIEELEVVERAWVHLDYETDHAPEHKWQKEIRETLKKQRAESSSYLEDQEEEEEHKVGNKQLNYSVESTNPFDEDSD
eukprot:TRINITY_DN5233_c0_g1_i4.p1 TRINITY_DN5233_c0_g1~~TRINITY_DN5233_c0_g1_i4.p1  ORF type:complete len:510 (-),score=108.38 TRINITY_DN5233_c0_g1_i4:36-1565(-)